MLNDAGHDCLTGLPDRLLLHDRLGQAMAQCRRRHGLLALIRIELDGIAALRERHRDRLVQTAASLLRADLRASDTVARVGEHGFALVVSELSAQDAAGMLARKILARLDAGLAVEGRRLPQRARIGIAVFPADGASPEQLLRNAGVAAAGARAAGVAIHRFAGRIEPGPPDGLARELERAIERGELSLEYQPQIALRTRQPVGLEALLRWHRPDHGTIEPEVFVALAEASGQIGRIGKWALAQACTAAAGWPAGPLGPVRVAVNFSTAQMIADDLPQVVRRALEGSGLPATQLELEMTERSILGDGEQVSERVGLVLRRLRAMGVRLALDDFGTGYASLRHLGGLPLDALKIDRSFVAGLAAGPDRAIVQCLIELAHRLGLRVTAEGVESEAQLAVLRDLGCDEMQGHLFGRPLPAADVAGWLAGARSHDGASR